MEARVARVAYDEIDDLGKSGIDEGSVLRLAELLAERFIAAVDGGECGAGIVVAGCGGSFLILGDLVLNDG